MMLGDRVTPRHIKISEIFQKLSGVDKYISPCSLGSNVSFMLSLENGNTSLTKPL